MIQVSGLSVHPIKGCRGTELEAMELDARGPALDRRFMIVQPSGEFVTQRQESRLALIRPAWSGDQLELCAPGMPDLSVALDEISPRAKRLQVQVWRFQGEAVGVSEEADAWLSEMLGTPLRLVRCAPEMDRVANPEWAEGRAPIAFSDGYPVLLLSEASLEALNDAMRGQHPEIEPFAMSRFRPNLVVRGCAAFAEDDWATLRMGEVVLDVVKPCDRCAVTTVDPETAQRGAEPLRTLARIRRSPKGVLFGQNCVARGAGMLEIGSEVEVLSAGRLARTPPDWRVAPL